MKSNFVSVATTIFSPTAQLKHLAYLTSKSEGKTIVVGDEKTPKVWFHPGIDFYSLDNQVSNSKFSAFSRVLPTNHYCRKNLGYLYAMLETPDWIYETDDDNLLNVHSLTPPSHTTNGLEVIISSNGWTNIFDGLEQIDSGFPREKIWPRGFPLELVNASESVSLSSRSQSQKTIMTPVANGIVNGDPDVDAIFRLTRRLPLSFETIEYDFVLSDQSWSPFNSQNTWWNQSAFSLMYLPISTSFRVTDILRSYIAQAILYRFSMGVRFYGPSAIQERNQHSLTSDFEQEIPLYTHSIEMMQGISIAVQLAKNFDEALRLAYCKLFELGHVQRIELDALDLWLAACKSLQIST